MIRFRKRLTLARLAAVPLIVGVTFAVGSRAQAPWQVSAVNAVLFVLPVFVTGATLTQWIAFYGVAGVIVGLLSPPVVTHCRPKAVARLPAVPPWSLSRPQTFPVESGAKRSASPDL